MITVLVVVAAALLYRARRRRRRDPARTNRSPRFRSLLAVIAIIGLHTFIGATPALAQECGTAPNPERPGSGMVGALDPAIGNGEKDSPYLIYGYAGMVWNVYDDNCVLSKSVTDPNATIDTWAGNELFNIGKNVVGATNSLHYTLLDGGVLGGLNHQIGQVASAVFDNVYMQMFGLVMLILAILLFRHIWRGDLATISKRTLFALGGMWLAASTMLLVNNYTRIDNFIVDTTNAIQGGFVDPASPRFPQHVLPADLHNRVVYDNWLRGEFGKPDDAKAVEFGRRLLDAQAWTRDDVITGRDADQAKMDAKKAEYKQIATQLGPATGYFKGTDGSRTGSGLLAMLQSFVYALFQLLAKLAVLLAQVLLRVLTLAAPVLGLLAMLHHDVLRRVGRAAGAVILNVLVLAVLAGIHFKFLQLIFSPTSQLSLLTQMLLAGLVTLIFFFVGKPMRRMWQMLEMSVSATGASMPASGGLFSRFRKKKGNEPTPQDEFWEHVRDGEADGTAPRPQVRRPRPEASHPVAATAERLDTRQNLGGYPGGPGLAVRTPAGALPPAGGAAGIGARPDLNPALGPGDRVSHGGIVRATASRVTDTVPVADRGWDRGEDAVVVASHITPPRRDGGSRREYMEPSPAQPPPRPADSEVVAGRPVHVVYRPSRGLEVRDRTAQRRMDLRDGPRDTDAVIR
ncbi:hypothetical protein EV193_10130 [Herbihabitans rhizosphaerae]|uniref:TrbL/VirB6 plasmid conjugal transfer protein n=1 Tax=Herbihabitans rhizosphaerae TaxID=1872711 RepID=A0A4Q7L4M6_9PSEU|nr:magnesium transporter [Herbihabitans rhizosphaerae]RZS44156.1 hypothetical protein EV193_10130 [Herbihabitans rhizosphaerae]